MRQTRPVTFIFAGFVIMGSTLLVQACSASGAGDDGFTTDSGADDSSVGADSGSGSDSGLSPDSDIPFEAGSADGGCFTNPPSHLCGVFPNCGCAGTTCDFESDGGGPVCAASAGSATAAQACTSTTDCVEGLTCLFQECHAYCGTPGAACADPKSSLCHTHAGITGFDICGIDCDPTSATSCGSLGCVATAAGSAQTTECEPVGATAVGGSCTTVLDCAPGLNCVNDGSLHCRKVCGPTGAVSGCSSGACTAVSPPITIKGVEYGYCP